MISNIYLGNTELTASNRFVTSVRNGGFPDIDNSTTEKGGYTGRTLSIGKFLSYKFVIEWVITATSFGDLATQREIFTQLLGQIVSAGSMQLKINKTNGVNLFIDIKGINVITDVSTQDPLSAVVLTEMEAEYPFLRSQALQSNDTSIFDGGGMPIPMPIPMPMSAGGMGEVILTNGGNYEAYPVFTFIGPLDNPTIANLTTGKELTINTVLATAADMIEVDTFRRAVVYRPSGVNAREFATGDFWTLAVGTNVIHLTNSSFNGVGKCRVAFYDTWLGV